MKKRDLERALQGLRMLESPDPKLEQYQTPPGIAADILYIALAHDDISGKSVIDLGCGNGTFSLGVCLLGAKRVTGVDIDPAAIEIARENSRTLGCDIELVCCGVEKARGHYDTCIQNPPFGSQKRHADVPFLQKAMSMARVTYSLHNSETDRFIEQRIRQAGGSISLMERYKFEIAHTFEFHRKERKCFHVTLYRIVNEEGVH
ncbi:MAG: methyltransferase [Thermoplasmata archaeon]|nr:methyltransferase [Thermoplasmata archaeon]